MAENAAIITDGAVRHLDPRWIPCQRRVALVSSAIVAIALAGGAAVVLALTDVSAIIAVGAVVLIVAVNLAVSLWWPAVAYRYASYRFGARALEIRRGVLWRSVIHVPWSRIQHSDVSQGPIERSYGLGTLSVFTAGMKHALVQLHGLDHSRAIEMRDHLLDIDDDDVV